MEAERRIGEVEQTLRGVADDITQTRTNVEESNDHLNSAENKCKELQLMRFITFM